MKSPISRRKFFVQSGCLCGGVLAAARLGQSACAAGENPAWLATCRDAVAKPTGKKDIWTALDAVGAEGLEVDVADDLSLPMMFHPKVKYTLATASGIKRVAADAKKAGKKITGFCLHNKFEAQPDAEVDICTRLAQAAQTLDVPMIRLDVVPASLQRPEFLKLAVKTLKRIIEATETTGVRFGVENHGNTTNDPDFLVPLFDGVGSDRLGLTLDTGNFYWFGHPLSKVYEFVERFAPRVFHTHCKNIRYPAEDREKKRPMGLKYAEYGCPIDVGDVDYARVVAILKKAGYHNDFCIENEFLSRTPGAEATKTLAREIEFLKQLRAKA
jgi:sugar phosphate isomerase/epimerase